MIAWRKPCRHIDLLLKQLCRPAPQPYAQRWQSTVVPSILELLKTTTPTDSAAAPKVTVHGFVRSVRKQKRIAFAAIVDGSNVQPLQVVLDPQLAEGLTTGTAVAVTGKYVPSTGAKQANEVQATGVRILGHNDATSYPIQKKHHTEEFLRTLPHLRVRTQFNNLLLQVRSKVIADVTRFFFERGYHQTHPPIITSSDCEGAGEVFPIGGLAPQTAQTGSNTTTPSQPSSADPFFRTTKYLTVSSQLHLEAMAQAVGKVWTLSPTFRAEGSDTPRHLSEFYMLEAEMAFVEDVNQVMDLVEDLISHIASEIQSSTLGTHLREGRPPALDDKGDAVSQITDNLEAKQLDARWSGLLRNPWPRITYHEACGILQAAGQDGKASFEHTVGAETGLQTEHERYIAEVVGQGGPVFVTDYPAAAKPFYMPPSSPTKQNLGPVPTVACFDLLLPDVCEVVGGSLREHRLDHLQEAMRQRGMLKPGQQQGVDRDINLNLDWYLDLRRYGSVPHGGFGMGFDRLLGYLVGVGNIRDVVAFPRYYGKCLC